MSRKKNPGGVAAPTGISKNLTNPHEGEELMSKPTPAYAVRVSDHGLVLTGSQEGGIWSGVTILKPSEDVEAAEAQLLGRGYTVTGPWKRVDEGNGLIYDIASITQAVDQ